MYPRRMNSASLQRQQGSMLVIALFVIIVMAAMAFALTRMLSSASDSVVSEVSGLRAFNTARSGLQDLVYQNFPASSVTSPPTTCSVSNTNGSFANNLGLTGCVYSASCTSTSIEVEGVPRTYFEFTSTGTCVISQDSIEVSRTIAIDALQ